MPTQTQHVEADRQEQIKDQQLEQQQTADEEVYEESEELDMEASLKLSCSASFFRFMCTLCSRLFSSYVNMCRHRKLAHGRYGICSPSLLANRKSKYAPLYKPTPTKSLLNMELTDPNHFSRIVDENLTNFLDGKIRPLVSLHPVDNLPLSRFTHNKTYCPMAD